MTKKETEIPGQRKDKREKRHVKRLSQPHELGMLATDIELIRLTSAARFWFWLRASGEQTS